MLEFYVEKGDSCRQARLCSWICNCFEGLGQLDSALSMANRGRALFNEDCDSLIWMSLVVNLTNVQLSLEEFDQVITGIESALTHWNPRWPFSVAKNGLLTNRAIALASTGQFDKALAAFKDVLSYARAEGRHQEESDALLNLSALFGMLGAQEQSAPFLDSSQAYSRMAITSAKLLKDHQGVAMLYQNMASIELDRKRYETALAFADTAEQLSTELGNLALLVSVADLKHRSYYGMNNLVQAYSALGSYVHLNDSLLNTEKVKAITEMQEKYESEKKAKEILGLKAVNLESELEKAQVKRTRNIYLFSAIGVVGLAIGLWSRLRFVHRSRAAIQQEKDISEGLLLNILPEEVAAELKAKGHADVKEFERATILFTDFKGFTQLTEHLTAAELVGEIDHCFKAFDGIMGKYRIEKIKTIGDAYMAAGGLPDTQHGAPQDVVRAALEMQAFMAAYKAERVAQGRLFFEMRVGVHTGPVIAGIVGVKKFAYDIWGDTVNTASRMESSGEVGRVNISEATYALVKEVKKEKEVREVVDGHNPQHVTGQPATEPAFTFTARGKVQAKGKGEMEMYFVEAA